MGYIYMIKNIVNNKCYIGQSVEKDINTRWKSHKRNININTNKSSPLYSAFRKYGLDKFEFKIICICFDDACDNLEIEYYNKFKTFIENLSIQGYTNGILILKSSIFMYKPWFNNCNKLNTCEDLLLKITSNEDMNGLLYDIKELNVWRQYDINNDKSKYRYNNTIPFWQRSMNIRHADRSNEGFREGNDAYRSSLDNPVYAYDMRRVKDLMNRYQNEEWFGF
jgi:hypothetical protein